MIIYFNYIFVNNRSYNYKQKDKINIFDLMLILDTCT